MQDQQFLCKICGNCCGKRKTSKIISLYPEERSALLYYAQIHNITLQIFPDLVLPDELHHRLYIARYKLVLPPDSHCPFLHDNRCQIYPHRPLACRAFPLIIKSGYQSSGDLVIDPHCSCIQSYSTKESICLDMGRARFYGLLMGARERSIFLQIQTMTKRQEFRFGKLPPQSSEKSWPEFDLIPS